MRRYLLPDGCRSSYRSDEEMRAAKIAAAYRCAQKRFHHRLFSANLKSKNKKTFSIKNVSAFAVAFNTLAAAAAAAVRLLAWYKFVTLFNKNAKCARVICEIFNFVWLRMCAAARRVAHFFVCFYFVRTGRRARAKRRRAFHLAARARVATTRWQFDTR